MSVITSYRKVVIMILVHYIKARNTTFTLRSDFRMAAVIL